MLNTSNTIANPPSEMAILAEDTGVKKANLPFSKLFPLAILAGAYIAFGAIIATIVASDTSSLPFGVAKLLTGLSFTLGLILVIVGGAELFTGNNLMVMAFASRKISFLQLIRNWVWVYFGNFIGSVLIAILMIYTRQYFFNNGRIGLTMLNIANAKCNLDFVQALTLGIMCNILVCLAVWLCFSAKTTTDKILSIIPPISVFVAAGFEHSVANMYFIPVGILLKQFGSVEFFSIIGKNAGDFSNLTWGNFFINNLLPVTIGNIIGGSLFVGLMYWFIFLRNKGK
jgi:formate transporter FocA